MAHALGAIDNATRDDLMAINAVRAVFAHAEMPVRFTSAPVRQKAGKFPAWKERASARRLFDQAVARTETAINAKMHALLFEHATTA